MYQLGDIQFDGLRGLDSLRKSRESVYAELPLMQGKPRLQRTGTALQQIEIGISLHAAFTDPAADISALDDYREQGTILPLISGEGENFGKFVIISISEDTAQTSPTGKVLSVDVNLVIREHFDPNPSATIEASAKAGAFALGTDKVVPVRLVRPPITQMAVCSQNTQTGISASAAGISKIHQAQVQVEQKQSLIERATASLNQAKKAYETAKEVATTYTSIAAKAPQLVDKIQSALDNIEMLGPLLLSGDITNALMVCDALESGIPAIKAAVLPLDLTLIQRKPQ